MKIIKKTIAILFHLIVLLTTTRAENWYSAASLNTPRGGSSAIVFGDYIYVLGGKSTDNAVLNTVERYDINSDQWDASTVPPFKYARYNAAAVVFENKIYLIGGRNTDSVLDETEVYDPVQNSWQEAHKLRKGREGFAGVVLNDRIYAIGGQKGEYELIEEIEWYDQAEDSWLEAGFNLPYPRAAHFSAAYQDTFYIFGGYYYGLIRTTYKAIPTDSGYHWLQNGDLMQGRAYGGTTLVRNDIYLIGGEINSGKTAKVEVYNIANSNFQSGIPISSPRSGLSAVTVKDTIIYVIGGFENANHEPVATVEYYYGQLTGIAKNQRSAIPEDPILIKGYPNPFNSSIRFSSQIPKQAYYEIAVYNVSGQKISDLFRGFLKKGEYNFDWQALPSVSSGLYILVVKSDLNIQKFKMMYVK